MRSPHLKWGDSGAKPSLELTHFVTGSVMFFVFFPAFRNLYTPPKTPFPNRSPARVFPPHTIDTRAVVFNLFEWPYPMVSHKIFPYPQSEMDTIIVFVVVVIIIIIVVINSIIINIIVIIKATAEKKKLVIS